MVQTITISDRNIECALIKERQREGIVLAKGRGAYKGRKQSFAVLGSNE